MSNGSLISSKGLIGGGSASPDVTPGTTTLPPSSPAQLQSATPRGTIMIIVPTAINTVLLVSENIVDNLRARQKSDITLPSMYKRAFLIAYETDEIALLRNS